MALGRRRRIRPAADEGAPTALRSAFTGMVLMAASFFLYAASGLVAPWWGVTILLLVWVAMFVLCCVWWTPHPRRLPLVAVASVLVWFVALVGGAAAFGWSA